MFEILDSGEGIVVTHLTWQLILQLTFCITRNYKPQIETKESFHQFINISKSPILHWLWLLIRMIMNHLYRRYWLACQGRVEEEVLQEASQVAWDLVDPPDQGRGVEHLPGEVLASEVSVMNVVNHPRPLCRQCRLHHHPHQRLVRYRFHSLLWQLYCCWQTHENDCVIPSDYHHQHHLYLDQRESLIKQKYVRIVQK